MALHPFRPRLLESLKGYDRHTLAADVGAGLTVGVIALPLAMAFAIASGLKPESGLFTAIIAGFLISLLGGSRVQIGGPAGAFIVIVYGIVQQYGLGNLLVSTAMAGVLLFVMGLTRIGSLIRYIPVAIVIGFTNGIAVLIALSQLKDLLGLQIEKMPADFFGAARAIAGAIDTVSLPTLALGLVSLAVIALWTVFGSMAPSLMGEAKVPHRRGLFTRLPSTLVVLVLTTVAVTLFNLPVETVGSRFGGIPSGLPAFALPDLSWDNGRHLIAPAVTIALLGAVESLLCARVADGMIDDRHDPNQELMAQGVANFITPFFGGMPATGTIARTSANVRSGGRTPISGIVHALTLLAIMLLAAPLASHVPLAALAAILLFVAWNMGDWGEFARLKQFSVQYRTIMVATFLLTVMVDLTVAVQIGLVLAALFFIHRISSLTTIEAVGTIQGRNAALPPGVAAYRIFGSLFFGAVGKLEALMETSSGDTPPEVLVLDLHMVINLDSTCLDTLEGLHRSLRKRGATLLLCDANEHPLSLMRRSGFLEKLGKENLLADLPSALGRAESLLKRREG